MIFDEEYVECSDCTSYWLSQCDGTPIPKECKAFIATRKKSLESLEKRLTRLEKSVIVLLTIELLIILGGVVYGVW